VGYLLDTNMLSDLMRRPRGAVAEKIAAVGVEQVATSIIVVAEIRFGIAKKASLVTQLNTVLTKLPVMEFSAPADEAYARLRAGLEQRGTPIGAMDMMIAAHALTLGDTLVTANERELSRVEGLRVENWLR